jgi:hypothetical protein
MQKIVSSSKNLSPSDWGQLVPTDLFKVDPKGSLLHLTLVPQYALLIHPAFGSMKKKGPMFPVYDYRVSKNFPQMDSVIDFQMFKDALVNATTLHFSSLVKVNVKEYDAGKKQSKTGTFPNWIARLSDSEISEMISAI